MDHSKYELYIKEQCSSCEGTGKVKVGEPLGTADGPQYGDCSTCSGSGKSFTPVKLVISIENR